jgi:hypothetical protein
MIESGSVHDVIRVDGFIFDILQHLPRGAEENHWKTNHMHCNVYQTYCSVCHTNVVLALKRDACAQSVAAKQSFSVVNGPVQCL